ncbi:MAG: hypothetical protein K8F25_15065 [Fimbriimonadaceae bacterium]|nr:hypothetical protein [Alphaproteobacteria bacterium]
MKFHKIAKELSRFFETDDSRQKEQVDAVRELLQNLWKKEKEYRTKLETAKSDKKRAKYERKLKLCLAHREKGEKALQKLSGSEM